MNPLKLIDDFLNGITMYRLLWWGLRVLIAIAVVFCFTGILSFSWTGLLISCLILVSVCWVTNWLLAWLYRAPANSESSIITALILTCILPQATTLTRGLEVAAVGLAAIASKYVIAWHHKHLFNPAAFGAAILAWSGVIYATWWIGNPYMLPFVAVFGLMLLRKIRRLRMFFVFAAAALVMGTFVAIVNSHAIMPTLHAMIFSGPLLFMGTIMLTEPATGPPRHYYQLLCGLLVGALFATQLANLSPQAALLAGNLLAFAVGFRQRLQLKLVKKTQLGPALFDFAFQPNRAFSFIPGQYLEWTLPHPKHDGRGNRRTFSIASAPTDTLVHLGTKLPVKRTSSFKAALMRLKPGDHIWAGSLAGDFCLPSDAGKPLVWIAGGIGITPYVSMARYLTAAKERRNVQLFYTASPQDGFAYDDVFDAAKAVGVTTVRTTERLSAEQLTTLPDATYFISGPPPMVAAYKSLLHSRHIPRKRIVTDLFAGY